MNKHAAYAHGKRHDTPHGPGYGVTVEVPAGAPDGPTFRYDMAVVVQWGEHGYWKVVDLATGEAAVAAQRGRACAEYARLLDQRAGLTDDTGPTTIREAVRYTDLRSTVERDLHRHEHDGQALVHSHPHDFPHGYFEHPEDGHPVTTTAPDPIHPPIQLAGDPLSEVQALSVGIFALNTYLHPDASDAADVDTMEARAEEAVGVLARMRDLLTDPASRAALNRLRAERDKTTEAVPLAIVAPATDEHDTTLRCPHCGAVDTIHERDKIETWNPVVRVDVDEDGALAGLLVSQQSGDREGDGWLCTKCFGDVAVLDETVVNYEW